MYCNEVRSKEMKEQTEAARLADLLDGHDGALWVNEAAAELRRLDQSEREGWRYADELEQERKHLEAEVQALRGAVPAGLMDLLTKRASDSYSCSLLAKDALALLAAAPQPPQGEKQ